MDNRVGNLLGIDNLYVVSYGRLVMPVTCNFLIDKSSDGIFKGLVMEMFHHESGELAVEIAEEYHVAVAHFIEHGDEVALAVSRPIGGFHRTDVADIAAVTDSIVVDVVADVLYQAVITNADVAQSGVIDARMFQEPPAHFDVLVEVTDTDFTIKHHTVHVIGLEIL